MLHFDPLFFDPAFFDTLAFTMVRVSVSCTMRVDLFVDDAWVEITDDVILGDRLRTWRGIQGHGPTDAVAATGTCEFSMRNAANNSAGLLGYYSPNHPNCREGFTQGALVRVVFTYDGEDHPEWTGKLRVIAPIPGEHGARRTVCLAHDYMSDLADADIVEVGQQINQTDSEVLEAILDSLPVASQPLARNIDPGIDVFAVALDDLGSDTKGLRAVDGVAISAMAKVFIAGSGTFTYQTRETVALQARRYEFSEAELLAPDGIAVPSDMANVFNKIRMVGHPKVFSPSPIVVASHTGTFTVAAGATEELFLTYRDPDRAESIGAKDGIQPVATTDYTFNAAADGSGANLTGNVTVTAFYWTSTVMLRMVNSGGTTAHKTLLQARATAIYDQSPVTRESYTAMAYGTRPLTIDRLYQANEAVLQADASYIDASYNDLRNQALSLKFEPQRSAALMEQAVTREIGDVVDVSETVTLPDGVSAFIQSKAIDVTQTRAGVHLTCTFGLAPRIVNDERHTDTVYIHDLLSVPISSGSESRIDFAMIDLSEIAA